ncbi:acyl-CoA dehydrogenase C-terminal domain-containing protein, partial [Klebsiella pneumoniae]|uniref:acyl-CoA dehydrogenase C-terminal domain-containing protein n=1 Tax=Klebsiella pneumoniae TaxID=573 RepID=UPI0027315510
MGRAALKASAAQASGSQEPFYSAKRQSADYAIRQWLPVGRAQRAVIEAGMASLAAFDATPPGFPLRFAAGPAPAASF